MPIFSPSKHRRKPFDRREDDATCYEWQIDTFTCTGTHYSSCVSRN